MFTSPPAPERTFPFNAFLSHNSKNKPVVRELKDRLVASQLKVWFDEDELRPGVPWQDLLEAGIRESQSVVVMVGTDGLGPWEDEEMQGALRLAVREKRPVIPVLLPGCAEVPELPIFLGNRTYVDLRKGISLEGFNNLLWGITGVKPKTLDGSPNLPTPPAISKSNPVASLPPQPRYAQPPPSLAQVLPGRWQAQVPLPFPPGAAGQLQLELFANGYYRGQFITGMGVTTVEGQWQANPFTNQLAFQGWKTYGFQTVPDAALLQVTGFTPDQLMGYTTAGQQLIYQRVGPPPPG
jgi:hypothetical protein